MFTNLNLDKGFISVKKVKLIKSLLISTPVIVTPLLANSCGSNQGNSSGKSTNWTPVSTNDAQYYVTILANQVQKLFATKTVQDAVTMQSSNETMHSIDFTNYINQAITSSIDLAKKDPNKPNDFAKENFRNIIITSTANNLWLTSSGDNYIMYVYPNWKLNLNLQTPTVNLNINYKLALNTGSYSKSLPSKFTLGVHSAIRINQLPVITDSVTSSSDGTKIFYESPNAVKDYFVYSAILQSNGSYISTPINLTQQKMPITLVTSSVDGNQVFYVSQLTENSWAIVNLKYDSTTKAWSKSTVLTSNEQITALKITADSTQIFYASQGNIYLTKFLKSKTWSNPVSIAIPIGAVINNWYITSDGTKIFYSNSNGDIFLGQKNTAGAFTYSFLYRPPADLAAHTSKFTMSKNGDRIFFIGEQNNKAVWVNGIIQTDKTYKWTITPNDNYAKLTAGSVNETGTAYICRENKIGIPHILVIPINQDGSLSNLKDWSVSELTDAVNTIYQLQFSGDGNNYFYFNTYGSSSDKNTNIYVARSKWYN